MAARFQSKGLTKTSISQSSDKSKQKTGAQTNAAEGGKGFSGKGNVQVIYAGRIVTPQSLVAKKSGFVQPKPQRESLLPVAAKPKEITTISELQVPQSLTKKASAGANKRSYTEYSCCTRLELTIMYFSD
jgi:hypothetical protein